MAKFIIDGITLEQAKELAYWYEGQGEQDADVWFAEKGIETPVTDVPNKKWMIVNEDTVTIQCK